jgi:hypothetical protein
MRTLLRVRIDTAAGSRAITNGAVERILGEFAARAKPEAAYFFSDQGKRTASFVFDMQDSSEIPALVEPLFSELEAEIELTPVMNLEDLQRGLAAFGSHT